MRHFVFASVCAALGVFNTCLAADMDVGGYWLMDGGSTIVEIADCGDGTPCGTVVWLDENLTDVLFDDQNPDETLRGRDLVGVRILEGFDKKSKGWRSGRIYNPENGKTYRSHLTLVSKNMLAVSGCLGPICKKMHWERAEGAAFEAAALQREPSEVPASL